MKNQFVVLLMICLVSFMYVGSFFIGNIGPVFAFTEGPSAGLEGFQYNSNDISTVIYPTNGTYTGPYNSFNPKYQFTQPWSVDGSVADITQTRIGDGWGAGGGRAIPISINTEAGAIHSRVRLDPDASAPTQSVTYDVLINTTGTPEVYKVVGQIKAYKLYLEISLTPNSNTADYFDDLRNVGDPVTVAAALKDVTLWYNIHTNVWDNCIDPVTGAVSNNAQNIPLSLYLVNVVNFLTQDTDFSQPNWLQRSSGSTKPFQPTPDMVSQCVQVSPANSGDPWDLFNSPSMQEQLTDRWSTTYDYSINNVNMTQELLASPYNISPFKEFQGSMWFKVQLTMFRPWLEMGWWTLNAADFPCIGFVGELYYLQLGTFTYEQGSQDKPSWTWNGWQQVFGPGHYLWDSLFSFLGMLNPFNIFGPFQGLVETLFLIFCLGFLIWIGFHIIGDLTGFHVEDYIHDLIYPAKVIYRNRPRKRKNRS